MRSWTAPPANDSQAPRGAYRSQHWPAGASASSLSAALATPAPRQLEQDMYRDTVTLTVSAEQRGRESEAVDNPNVAIGLESVEPGVLKLHFERPGERYPHLLQPDHRPHLLRPDPRRRGQRERRLDDLRERHARPGATGLIDSPSQPSTMRKAAKWHFDTPPPAVYRQLQNRHGSGGSACQRLRQFAPRRAFPGYPRPASRGP